MSDPTAPSGKELRQVLGLARELPFRDEASPRPVDVDQIRALHHGDLEDAVAEEVRGLTTRYREWHQAERKLLLELLVGMQSLENPDASQASQQYPGERSQVGSDEFENSISVEVAPKRTERPRSTFGFVAVAVAVAVTLVVGLFSWFGRNGQPELISYLDDAFGRVGTDRDGNVYGLDSYPTMWREELAAIVRGGVVHVPDEPLALRDRQRGGSVPTMYIQPVATVIKSVTPTLEWRPRGADATYRVRIYRNGQRVVESEELKDVSWRCVQELERGAVYTWDVIVYRHGDALVLEKSSPQFKVVETDSLQRVAGVEKTAGGSHLVLVITYLQAGLLDDTERELSGLITANPDSKLAEKLLKSIREQR